MLEVYRHGGGSARHGAFGGGGHHNHHHSSAIVPHRPFGGFGALGDWTDALIPRNSASSSSPFNVWDLSPNKLRTAAVAFTFVVTAGYISMLAAGGLLAILVTGAVVTCCVLLTVLTCATLITLIVTGVPVGYALIRLAMAARSKHGAGCGGGPGLFAGLFGHHDHDHHREHEHRSSAFGAHGPHSAGGWQYHADDGAEADDD